MENNRPSYKIPDKLKKVLKKGEYAQYEVLDIFDGNGVETLRDLLIPSTDVIQDPDSGEIIPIGYVVSWKGDGTPNFGEIIFRADAKCKLILKHGARDAAAYQYLEITNFNSSNPHRDINMPMAFKAVDSTGGSRESRVVRDNKLKAMSMAAEFSDAEILKFVQANAVKIKGLTVITKPDGEVDYEEIRDVVERLAETNPAKFLSLHVSTPKPVNSTEALVDQAINNGIIAFDKEAKGWYNMQSGKTFLVAKSIKNGVPKKELNAWLATDAGKKVLSLISEVEEIEA